jgi:hypothetical protein
MFELNTNILLYFESISQNRIIYKIKHIENPLT